MQAVLGIVYHSQSGANQALAQAAYHGAQQADGVTIKVFRACDVSSKDLLACTGLILCFSEMNGSLAGGIKESLDRVFYPLLERHKILPCQIFMAVGNDGTGALNQYKRIATGLNLTTVAEPIIVKGEPNSQALSSIKDAAHGFAEGLAMGIF